MIHDLYVASGLIAVLAVIWAVCLVVSWWADRNVTRAVHDALDDDPCPPAYDWANEDEQ